MRTIHFNKPSYLSSQVGLKPGDLTLNKQGEVVKVVHVYYNSVKWKPATGSEKLQYALASLQKGRQKVGGTNK